MQFLRFLLILVLLYVLYRLTKGILRLSGKRHDRPAERPSVVKGEDLVEDPFCHTHVPVSWAYRETIEGRTIYFCSRECFEKYVQKMETGKAGNQETEAS